MFAEFAGKSPGICRSSLNFNQTASLAKLTKSWMAKKKLCLRTEKFSFIRLCRTFQILMSASIIPETWHEARMEKTKIESKINKRNFHRFIIASTSEWKAIAPQTDWMSSFFHRLEFEAKSVLAELLSCAKKAWKCLSRLRAATDKLCDSMIWFFMLCFYSETTAKCFLAKLAACVSARGHRDRYFSELASNTILRTF